MLAVRHADPTLTEITSDLSARHRAYAHAVRLALIAPTGEADLTRWLTTRCPECNAESGLYPSWHTTVGRFVVIGCEGFFVVNPNAVGVDSPNWQDWTADAPPEG